MSGLPAYSPNFQVAPRIEPGCSSFLTVDRVKMSEFHDPGHCFCTLTFRPLQPPAVTGTFVSTQETKEVAASRPPLRLDIFEGKDAICWESIFCRSLSVLALIGFGPFWGRTAHLVLARHTRKDKTFD